jgi:hypothetical protein
MFRAAYFVLALAVAGCGQTPVAERTPVKPSAAKPHANNPYAAKSTDQQLARGPAFVDERTEVNGMLKINGNVPTPCHQLRVAMENGTVAIWSVVDAQVSCAQTLAPFAVEIPLAALQESGKQ